MLVPEIYKIKSMSHDTSDVYSFILEKNDGGDLPAFKPGQFNMLYLPAIGEVAISISGRPDGSEGLKHTIRAIGSVTKAMQCLKVGDEIGVRGPFGTHWPLEKTGLDVLVIAGGLGIAPVRPVMHYLANHRTSYKSITLLYGSKTPQDILYKDDLDAWKKMGLNIEVTVDTADGDWQGYVGVVTRLVKSHLPHPKKTLIFICGPEIMMQYAVKELETFPTNNALTFISMERNMQCAVGFCGHCQYGPHFICKDGPVFSMEQVKDQFFIEEV